MNKEIIKKIIRNENVVIYDGVEEWLHDFPFFEMLKTLKYKNEKKKKLVYNILTSLDIETSRITEKEISFCYIWQFNIYMNGKHHIILDRYIENTVKVFDKLYRLTKTKNDCLFICGISNLGYEFQFYKNLLNWKSVFAKEKRKPITATIDGIYFVDTLQISHKSIEKLGKEFGVKKLKDKMNYDILRTSKTEITNEEYAYCCNDVIIPCLYLESLVQDYFLKFGFFPITQTSKVRFKMKNYFKNYYGKSYKKMADYIGENLYPPTFEEYKNDMKYLFRGAWTHGNPKYAGMILKNVDSYDITSSYIYTMFCDKFPMERFMPTSLKIENIDTNIYAFKGIFIFYNLQAKNNISYESIHKSQCKSLINDNGKIYYAEECKVYLTDVDFDIYNRYYSYSDYEVFDLQISKKEYLPKYVINPMIETYSIKQKKKINGENYVTEKEEVNSFYGMMVTRIPLTESIVEDGEWLTIDREFPYDDRNRTFLSPYWGIWVTAYSRKHLFDGIDCFNKFYYSDTDSVKGIVDKHKLEKLNDSIFENVKNSKKHFNINNSLVDDLGNWDNEGRISIFKYLGAKRYLCYKKGKVYPTIAGCPKYEYTNHYKKNMFAIPFYEFRNNFSLKSVKLRSIYNDNSYDIVVDNCIQKIYGCNTLTPTDFTMSLAHIYIEFIKHLRKMKSEGKNYD